jgi:uncharacterized protein YyaL (SSP411 family)
LLFDGRMSPRVCLAIFALLLSLCAPASAQTAAATATADASQPAAVQTIENATAFAASAAEHARGVTDREHGGVAEQPRLLHPALHSFLLRDYARGGSQDSRDVATESLRKIAAGSVRDQLGGGFHRGAADASWRRPFVEMTLVDQALMADAFLDAYQVTHEPRFGRIARAALDAILREFVGEQFSGFYTALGNSSIVAGDRGPEVVKDVYYSWTEAELRRILGTKAGDLAVFRFGLETHGNIKPLDGDPAMLREHNFLFEAHGDSETRTRFGMTQQELGSTLDAIETRLLESRRKRPRPPVDTAVVTGENALAISALARGGTVLDEPRFVTAAASAMRFLLAKRYDAKTQTLRHLAGSTARDVAPSSDYAFEIAALLDTYEARFDVQSLGLAMTLQQSQDRLYGVEVTVETGSDDPLPTATSITASNLMRLGELFDSPPWRARAVAMLRTNAGRFDALPRLASVLEASLMPARVVVLIANLSTDDAKAMLRAARERLLPNVTIVLADARLEAWMPYTKGLKAVENKPTAYICHAGQCSSGINDPAVLAAALSK